MSARVYQAASGTWWLRYQVPAPSCATVEDERAGVVLDGPHPSPYAALDIAWREPSLEGCTVQVPPGVADRYCPPDSPLRS